MGSLICRLCLIGQYIEVMAVRGRFLVTPSSYIKLVRAVYRQRMFFVFGTLFRHVALLVTEISRQDQNFRISPRTCMLCKSDVIFHTILSSADIFNQRFKIIFQDYHLSVKQFGSRSGLA